MRINQKTVCHHFDKIDAKKKRVECLNEFNNLLDRQLKNLPVETRRAGRSDRQARIKRQGLAGEIGGIGRKYVFGKPLDQNYIIYSNVINKDGSRVLSQDSLRTQNVKCLGLTNPEL